MNKKLSKLKIKGVKHYAEVFYPGLIFAGASVQKVAERTQDQIKFHEGACGFRFFDEGYVKEKVDGKFVKKPLQRINESNRTYIGEFLNLEQIANEYGKDSILYGNVQRNGYIGAVRTLSDNCYGVLPNEKVIDPSQVKFVNQKNEQTQNAERTM